MQSKTGASQPNHPQMCATTIILADPATTILAGRGYVVGHARRPRGEPEWMTQVSHVEVH